MNTHVHSGHKMLVVILLLVVFSVPFLILGVHAPSDSSVLEGGVGVIGSDPSNVVAPAPSQQTFSLSDSVGLSL